MTVVEGFEQSLSSYLHRWLGLTRTLSNNKGRAGLGSILSTRYESASGRERQRLVQKEVQALVEEERTSRAVTMRQQGTWMKWEQAIEWHVTWKDI